ncbi:MAG TPA: amino acid adenylation domain-containing protein [Verrucomicrobiae bacterium]|nr:amino acid adenylation domain-containing protein [Verrucomicrobiae bacterium]
MILERLQQGKLPEQPRDPALNPRRDGERLPLSSSQERLWFIERLEPGSCAYNLPLGLRLRGRLDIFQLQRALNEIVVRHEAVRTTFETIQGRPVQVIHAAAPLPVPLLDLQGLPANIRESELSRACREEAQGAFELSRDWPFRAKLVRMSDNDHVLVFTMHHIASDGWSFGVLLTELRCLYNAFVQGQSSPLPALALQYSQYVGMQREMLDNPKLASQLAYWRQNLAGAPLLELPADRRRPSEQTTHGAVLYWDLPEDLLPGLERLNRAEGVTLFMTLLAAFQTVLHRYCRCDDILVGCPIAGRRRAEFQTLIGLFVNTIVLRGDLSGDPSFRGLLARTRNTALEAYRHQDLPFEKLVEELHPQRDLSRSPLFQVMLVLQNVPWGVPELRGLEVTEMRIDTRTSKFDLTLDVSQRKEVLRLAAEYNTDLFDEATIARMLGHYQTLLLAVAANPDQRLSQLPLLRQAERQQLLLSWNETSAAFPRGRCLHDVFEAQARRTPHKVAVVCEGSKLTYRQLDERANQLAHRLQKAGVGPDMPVGICLERSVEMVVGLLGILKAGGAYLPLDPGYPKERLQFMLEDSGAKVLLTQEGLVGALPPHQARVIQLDGDWGVIGQESRLKPQAGVTAEHLAYLIYTSGSTGKPKGVEIQHRSLLNLLHSMGQKPGLREDDRLLAITTLSFDIAGLELWLPLISGAQVIIARRETARDGAALAGLLERCEATVLQATPSTLRLLLAAGWEGNSDLKLLCGGEPWQRDLAGQLLGKCGSLWNMYGPTETTIWSGACKVEAEQEVLIGGPIANTQFYVLDGHLQPVPMGVAGELWIGGEGVARGYYGKPALTRERFRANPFSGEAGGRIYRTGDLVRWREEGKIEFLERLDHQVKIRGFRVELGEIEAVLSAHAAVKQAVVVAQADGSGEGRLAAYVLERGRGQVSVAELREHLKARLPAFMIPAAFVTLEHLPMTPNGKIDRKQLPQAEPMDLKDELPHLRARDAIEGQLAAIWQRILGVKQVGMRDDFFELGGHSLLGLQLFAEIEQILHQKLPLAALFRSPTIEALAELIRTSSGERVWRSLVLIRDGGSKQPLFLVHGAEGNVILYRQLAGHLTEDRPVYGLQAQGLDGQAECPGRFEDIAAHYIREIRSVQRQGPYYLGGYCLGGALALEMAHQLQQQGQTVGLVALIESYNIHSLTCLSSKPLLAFHACQNVIFHVQNLVCSKRSWPFLREKLRVAIARARVRLAAPFEPQRYPHLLIKRALHQAQSRYTPKPYAGRVTLFRPRTFFLGLDDASFGWAHIVKAGLEVDVLPAYPKAMLVEPFVQVLAARLEQALGAGVETDMIPTAENPVSRLSAEHCAVVR